MKTTYWFDTEFMEDGSTIELLSIGVVCEDGRELYLENRDADWSHANQWVDENVLPHMLCNIAHASTLGKHDPCCRTRPQIAHELTKFVEEGDHPARFWAYYGDYDWVVLAQLFGRMVDMPESWPKFAMDIKQLAVHVGDPDLPAKLGTEHNALDDARWNKLAWDFLEARANGKFGMGWGR